MDLSSNLGTEKILKGAIKSGFRVELTTRAYSGKEVNVWGAEGTIPRDILWKLRFAPPGMDFIDIDSFYLRDLSNIIENTSISTIETLVSVDENRLKIIMLESEIYRIILCAGDGVFSYCATIDIANESGGGWKVCNRVVEYVQSP